ncbi:MAG: aspartate 1-decarboxylase [Desulfovibrionaceae bacterium]|nr:aspartate 1-decarboxylase [Desulfovibrionaceae bacterium]
MIRIMRAKLHGIHVTGCDLDYHGSVTLDPEHCAPAGIYPLEFVSIWNKNSGQRISTYVIYGEPGSKCCILNGAAARTCQKGDELIICASEYIDRPEELYSRKPVVLTFDADNTVRERLRYVVGGKETSSFDFDIIPEAL